MKKLINIVVLSLCIATLAACAMQPVVTPTVKKQEKLIIHPDGTYEFRERPINKDEVVIYPDGFGGERAAVKVYVPLHPDYYRDTIVVERRTNEDTIAPAVE